MAGENILAELRQALFSDPGYSAYVILDGASIPTLEDRLYDDEPEYRCLYTGNLEPDVLSVAPYVVKLEEGSPFTEWVLQEGWGKHWGVFAIAGVDTRKMWNFLRTLLKVEDPDGNTLLFRFYDPRVLRSFLPTCDVDQLQMMFGPIENYYLESEQDNHVLSFRLDEKGLDTNLAQ
jgi:hypothetical protein